MRINQLFLIAIIFIVFGCSQGKKTFVADFDNTHDRVWVGKDFWSIPLEEWKVADGKLYCTGETPDAKVVVLTHVITNELGDYQVSAKFSLVDRGEVPGAAGFLIGMKDKEDSSAKAACYFGQGIRAGVSLNGFAFLGDEKVDLPIDFDFNEFRVKVTGNTTKLKLEVTDSNGEKIKPLICDGEGIEGLVALVNNLTTDENETPGTSEFCFDDLKITGSKIEEEPENTFGPVLWTMYTLNQGTVKLMALLPPIGEEDNQAVTLQLRKGEEWKTEATEIINPDSRTVVFRIINWDDTREMDYRIEYNESGKDGTEKPYYYSGTIRKDPVDKPLKLGALTCQFQFGFPYTPIVENLKKLNPDLLYFSGDQIYEGNGGYGIKREPTENAILNYLGKYYMFGWAFRDLMRDRPTICTPDDHDVFQGNLWGEGGTAKVEGAGTDDTGGFTEPVKMINVVNRTQCGQLPDPYDPTSIGKGMSVWYTGLTYGRINFAIVSDRIFKSGPEEVAEWEGRHDHLTEPKDVSLLDKPGLKLLGDRQMIFLKNWITDWNGADMKVLLSQTLFANVATHHGEEKEYIYGDLDSGGWPKSGRDKVIELMRKAAVFHINGDQHLPLLVQYGLNNYRDAGWSFCTPAISTMYLRWFLPDELGVPVLDRPEHNYPNTGEYTDAFGNKNFVYAVGNPGDITADIGSRYNHAQIRSSGFGFVTFNKKERTINIDAWRFKADVENPNPTKDEFPGWPLKISQFDNLGMGATNVLPEITVSKPNHVICIWKEKTGELVNAYRMKGDKIQPHLFDAGTYRVVIGEGENKVELRNLKTKPNENSEKVAVEL